MTLEVDVVELVWAIVALLVEHRPLWAMGKQTKREGKKQEEGVAEEKEEVVEEERKGISDL